VVDPERPDLDQADDRGDDVAALRQERDALAARVAALEHRQGRRRRLRHAALAILVVIGIVSFTLSAVGWWARRNVADTDVWMQRVGPLADDPAVQAALGTWLGNEVIQLIDPEELFEEVLPERGQLLAGPLSGAVESFVRDRIDGFLASDRFERLWLAANETAHRAIVRVLRGESDVVQAEGDNVVINLVPVVDAALEDVSSASPELLGREVDLPDLSVEDLPDAAIQRLEQALGVQLDDDFGQFVVYDNGRLSALQEALERARRWLIGLSVITVAALGAALWISDRRRRTALQILAGLAIGLAVIRRVGIRGQQELLAAIPNQVNRAAADAVSDRFLGPLLDVTRTLLIVIAVLAAVLVLSGPYPWAVRLRRKTVELARGLGDRTTGLGERAGGWEWVAQHRTEIQVGGAAIAVLVLLIADLSFLGLAALALLLVLGWILLDRVPRVEEAQQA
jgi:hypothetical protein